MSKTPPELNLERATRGAALYANLRDALATRTALDDYINRTPINVTASPHASRVVFVRAEPLKPGETSYPELHAAWEQAAMNFVLANMQEVYLQAIATADEAIRKARFALIKFEAEVGT